VPRLSEGQRRALTTALAGLYKRAGVDLVRQQVEALLPPEVSAYDVVDDGLVVWAGADFDAEAVYPLGGDADPVAPRTTAGSFPVPLPALPAVPLLFREVEVTWAWWVQTWEGDQAGKLHPAAPAEGVRLLPDDGAGGTGPCPAGEEFAGR
jgi:hypothetical protein